MKTLVATLLLLAAIAAQTLQAVPVPEIVKDIFEGANSSLPSAPQTLVASGATLFFGANDGIHGVELWRSDSQSGATLVKDIVLGPGSSSPQRLVNVGGILFFTADDGTTGRELWRSDGTEDGTYLVKDILVGANTSSPEELVAQGGALFFSAWDGSRYALWRSDGTESGTSPVKFVNSPRHVTAVGDRVYFVGAEFASGRELWVSDGTESGTFLVKDIVPGSGSPTILDSFVDVGGRLFFRVWAPSGIGLWRSDGTEAGTVAIRNVSLPAPQGGAACATAPLSHLVAVGDTLFFSGDDGELLGEELWRSDGTEAGTYRVKDIAPGATTATPRCLVAFGGNVYFSASDGATGHELWRSDGTADGTFRVKDIVAGSSGSAPHFLTNVAGTLFFSATDTAGTELWRSDGTESGTNRVADIAVHSSSPQSLVAAGEMLFFSADDGTRGREPWVLASMPVANAGPDQSVGEGEVVMLDGSGSIDPEGDPLQYDWQQITGPLIAISDATSVHPTFVAPNVNSGGATLTFRLTVSDGAHDSDPDSVEITVSNVNNPPVADAGVDQTVQEGSPVTLHGGDSFDPNDDALTYAWAQTAGPAVSLSDSGAVEPTFAAPPVGSTAMTLVFVLTVSDGTAQSADDVQIVVTNVNQTPVANAGFDQTVDEATSSILDGGASSDPDGDALTYQWIQLSGPALTLSDPASALPGFVAPDIDADGGVLVFQLTVSDGSATSAPDSVNVFVRDSGQPPACTLAQATPNIVWPPNHKLLRVAVGGVADPDDSDVTITIVAVTQDEPVNGLGDGDTGPDAVRDGQSVMLRAERGAHGTGRVYVITFLAEDASGAVCSGSVGVCVPRDGRAGLCTDEGQNFNSFVP